MRHWLYPILFITVFAFSMGLSARPYSFMLSDKELSSNLINTVYQDRDGIIWIATENGLNRYDGTKVTIYTHEKGNPHSLAHNYVTYIYEDSHGNFYVGTYSGIQLYRRDRDDFTEIGRFGDGSRMQYSPSHIVEYRNRRVFSTGSQICEITVKEGKLELQLPNWDFIDGITGRVFPDSIGRVWTKHNDGNLICIQQDGTVIRSAINNQQTITNLLSDNHNNLYLQTTQLDLLKFDYTTEDWNKINRSKISNSTLKCIYRLDDTHILIGTDGNGIKHLDEVTGEVTDYAVDLPYLSSKHLKVHQIMCDRDGGLWLALFLKGVARIPSPKQQSSFHYMGSQSYASNLVGTSSISALLSDRHEQMWVGTDGEGIYLINKELKTSQHLHSTNDGGSIPTIIQGLYEDSEGNIWVGSYDEGCGIIHPQTFAYRDCSQLFRREGNIATRVFAFQEDHNQHIWVGSMGQGLFCYDMKTHRTIPNMCFGISQGLNLWQTSLLLTSDNQLLIGTYDGVFVLDLNQAAPRPRQLFDRSIIFSLYEDQDHNFWAAGDAGITKFTLDSISETFNAETGLAGNVAYSIIGDSENTLWIGTNRGLSHFWPKQGTFINYTDGDGLQGNEFSKNSCTSDSKGRLWFGGAYGINYFYPTQITTEQKVLKARISAFYLNNNPINSATLSGGEPIIEGSVYDAHHFSLLHQDNAFSIELSTVGFTEPDAVRYQYRVNNNDWTSLPQGSHQVSFGGLHPGTLRFQFKAIQNQQESETEEIHITIRPYWWESSLAQTIYLLLVFLFLGTLFYQMRLHYHARSQMMEEKHAHEIDEAKLRFFTNITHEIRTPMTLIVSPLQKLISTDFDPIRQQAYQTMKRNANMLLQLVNQLLDIRKIDNNQMRLDFQETEILSLVNNLVEFFVPTAESKHIQFEYTHEGLQSLKLWVDPNYFNKIIINLLSNAFKYTPANGKVSLSITIDPLLQDGQQHVLIQVSDDGIGIAPEERELIFDRFYRASNANLSADGNGVGLHLTRSLVTLHHGTIHADENQMGKGTIFTVRLPIGNAHLSEAEKTHKDAVPDTLTTESNSLMAITDEQDEEQARSTSPRTRFKLMIVDDDTEIRSYLSNELSRDFRITECENGQQAIQEIFRDKPDIVISDIMMPQVDGLTLCQRIKSNIGLNHIPVILLTAKADQESNLAGLDSGADAYITKPFFIEILRSTALNLVRSRNKLRNTYSGNQTQEDKLETIDLPSPNDKLQERIMRSINQNLSNPDFAVDELCADVGISRVHLYRKLKELTNQSPRDFIRNIRLKQAEILLLKEDSYSVNEIAEAVGFRRPNNFSAAFKEQYGYPPLQWRAMRKEAASK